MPKFCENCGAELTEGQDVCLKCGKVLSNKIKQKTKNYKAYIISSGIIMLVFGFLLIIAMGDNEFNSPLLILGVPGLLTIVAGVLALCSLDNKNLLLLSGIFLIISAMINIVGIADLSIFSIVAVIFGVLNIVFSSPNR